jgi:hypothetical protein
MTEEQKGLTLHKVVEGVMLEAAVFLAAGVLGIIGVFKGWLYECDKMGLRALVVFGFAMGRWRSTATVP